MHGEGEWRNNAFCHGRVNSRNENMFPSPQTPPPFILIIITIVIITISSPSLKKRKYETSKPIVPRRVPFANDLEGAEKECVGEEKKKKETQNAGRQRACSVLIACKSTSASPWDIRDRLVAYNKLKSQHTPTSSFVLLVHDWMIGTLMVVPVVVMSTVFSALYAQPFTFRHSC